MKMGDSTMAQQAMSTPMTQSTMRSEPRTERPDEEQEDATQRTGMAAPPNLEMDQNRGGTIDMMA